MFWPLVKFEIWRQKNRVQKVNKAMWGVDSHVYHQMVQVVTDIFSGSHCACVVAGPNPSTIHHHTSKNTG